MAIYIANENGDWWEHVQGAELYILDVDKLSPETLATIEEEWGPLADLPDKFEKVIWRYGRVVNQDGIIRL